MLIERNELLTDSDSTGGRHIIVVSVDWREARGEAAIAAVQDEPEAGSERLTHVRVDEWVESRAHIGDDLNEMWDDYEQLGLAVLERVLVDVVEHLVAPVGRPAHDVADYYG